MYFKGFPRFIINKLKTRNMSIADPHKAEVKGQKQKEKGQKAEWGKENIYVDVQFYPWFEFYFPLFWGMIMCDNEFKTKGNKS